MPQFDTLPFWLNLSIFAGAAVCVWVAGTSLARRADVIASRTGLSHAFLGVVLLGIATSLPEIATTTTAAAIGNTRLVSNNLFGGVALMGIGATPVLLLVGYLVTVWLSQPGEYLPRWRATHTPTVADESEGRNDGPDTPSAARLYLSAGAAALVILAAGWALAQTGDALADQTGLGASFVGVALVAASTSLPELSTTLGATRQGNHQMAVSNILGTNCLEVALFFLADSVYRGGPILAEADRSALFAATVGMVVTCIFLIGLLERRDRTVLGMGVDSLAVLLVYGCGLAGLYALR